MLWGIFSVLKGLALKCAERYTKGKRGGGISYIINFLVRWTEQRARALVWEVGELRRACRVLKGLELEFAER